MMSNEEWDRKAEFLLNQQAKFDARMDRLEAQQAETSKKLERVVEIIASQSAVMFEGFKVLSESHKLTEEALRKLEEKLTTRFDRHLSEGHPGLGS